MYEVLFLLLLFFFWPEVRDSLKFFWNNQFRHSNQNYVKEAQSRLAHIEKFSLNFSNSSFVIRVNLLHP